MSGDQSNRDDRFADAGGTLAVLNEDGTGTVFYDGDTGLPAGSPYPVPKTPAEVWLEAQRAKRAAKRDADTGDVDYPADEPVE